MKIKRDVKTVRAKNVIFTTCDSSIYNDAQDWFNNTQSSGKISGGEFTDNVGTGTITVAAGTGIFRAAATSDIEPGIMCDWDANVNVTLTDESTNYIIATYGNPIVISATTTKTDGNNRSVILLGKVFRDGTTLHFAEAGMIITEATKRTLTYLTQMFGEVARASGYVIGETGERYLTTTDGVLFAGLTRLTTTAIDTSGADTFETYYYDGDLGTPAWVEGTASQIDNANWNDVATGLDTLTANRYGVHWAYGDPDGHLMIVYGQGDYTLALAEAAQPPSSLPDHISEFGFLAAKIIVQEGEANLYSIASAYDTAFNPAGSVDHGELAGLADNDHPQYLLLAGGVMSGDLHLATGVDIIADGTGHKLGDTAYDGKYFSSANISILYLDPNNSSNYIGLNSNDIYFGATTRIAGSFLPTTGGDLGNPSYKWGHFYLSGDVSDGTNATSAAEIKAAYDHSQIAGGDSVHVSTTENTNWDTAYTHSQDNTQAHTDYLLNSGADVFGGTLEPDTDDSYDIGATGKRINDLFIAGDFNDDTLGLTLLELATADITFFIDGGGAEIADGISGWIEIPFACTILQCTLLADQSGSITIDIWKDSYANYPPDNADTITGGNEPAIAAGVKDQDGTLTDWTTSVSAGDILYFNVDSCTTIEKCLVSLKIKKV